MSPAWKKDAERMIEGAERLARERAESEFHPAEPYASGWHAVGAVPITVEAVRAALAAEIGCTIDLDYVAERVHRRLVHHG